MQEREEAGCAPVVILLANFWSRLLAGGRDEWRELGTIDCWRQN